MICLLLLRTFTTGAEVASTEINSEQYSDYSIEVDSYISDEMYFNDIIFNQFFGKPDRLTMSNKFDLEYIEKSELLCDISSDGQKTITSKRNSDQMSSDFTNSIYKNKSIDDNDHDKPNEIVDQPIPSQKNKKCKLEAEAKTDFKFVKFIHFFPANRYKNLPIKLEIQEKILPIDFANLLTNKESLKIKFDFTEITALTDNKISIKCLRKKAMEETIAIVDAQSKKCENIKEEVKIKKNPRKVLQKIEKSAVFKSFPQNKINNKDRFDAINETKKKENKTVFKTNLSNPILNDKNDNKDVHLLGSDKSKRKKYIFKDLSDTISFDEFDILINLRYKRIKKFLNQLIVKDIELGTLTFFEINKKFENIHIFFENKNNFLINEYNKNLNFDDFYFFLYLISKKLYGSEEFKLMVEEFKLMCSEFFYKNKKFIIFTFYEIKKYLEKKFANQGNLVITKEGLEILKKILCNMIDININFLMPVCPDIIEARGFLNNIELEKGSLISKSDYYYYIYVLFAFKKMISNNFIPFLFETLPDAHKISTKKANLKFDFILHIRYSFIQLIFPFVNNFLIFTYFDILFLYYSEAERYFCMNNLLFTIKCSIITSSFLFFKIKKLQKHNLELNNFLFIKFCLNDLKNKEALNLKNLTSIQF
ncbi:hypothetical protein GVAV_002742 [Gurleya vavrai]